MPSRAVFRSTTGHISTQMISIYRRMARSPRAAPREPDHLATMQSAAPRAAARSTRRAPRFRWGPPESASTRGSSRRTPSRTKRSFGAHGCSRDDAEAHDLGARKLHRSRRRGNEPKISIGHFFWLRRHIFMSSLTALCASGFNFPRDEFHAPTGDGAAFGR